MFLCVNPGVESMPGCAVMMETRKCLDIIAAASTLMVFRGNFIRQFSSLIIGHFSCPTIIFVAVKI